MRRKKTRVTVWPAIADLMTAILVIAFLTGMVTIAYNYSPDDPTDTVGVDSSEYRTVLRQVDSLKAVIEDIVGIRSCLGKERENMPNSLMTIRVTSNGYYIKADYVLLNKLREQTLGWRKLMDNIDRYNGRELSKPEMALFAKELSELGKNWSDRGCKFSPTFENGGVSPDSLHNAWYKFLGTYLGPLTNPWILPTYE
ncbi:MAG: hypothetical protein F4100_11600 [Rhodothermaceae bacterium]|nr:hypothetical protein [Rhodothermaceae bacterium]MYJ21363.1 hypothetical protein [Rhodothermaceae bacterium]